MASTARRKSGDLRRKAKEDLKRAEEADEIAASAEAQEALAAYFMNHVKEIRPYVKLHHLFNDREEIVVETAGCANESEGSAICIYFGEDHPLNAMGKILLPRDEVALCELAAIQVALRMMYRIAETRNRPIIIRTDERLFAPEEYENDRVYKAEFTRMSLLIDEFPKGVLYEHVSRNLGDPAHTMARLALKANVVIDANHKQRRIREMRSESEKEAAKEAVKEFEKESPTELKTARSLLFKQKALKSPKRGPGGHVESSDPSSPHSKRVVAVSVPRGQVGSIKGLSKSASRRRGPKKSRSSTSLLEDAPRDLSSIQESPGTPVYRRPIMPVFDSITPPPPRKISPGSPSYPIERGSSSHRHLEEARAGTPQRNSRSHKTLAQGGSSSRSSSGHRQTSVRVAGRPRSTGIKSRTSSLSTAISSYVSPKVESKYGQSTSSERRARPLMEGRVRAEDTSKNQPPTRRARLKNFILGIVSGSSKSKKSTQNGKKTPKNKKKTKTPFASPPHHTTFS